MHQKRVAFIFPGQGAQSLGLLSSLAAYYPIIKSVFAEASEYLDYDVWELAQRGPLAKLNETRYTQPVLLTAGVALWKLWHSEGGVSPCFLAGHSLGEYTACTCAQSFTFEAAIKLVAERGDYMQAAVANIEGGMALIVGLNHRVVTKLCKTVTDQTVVPSSYNAPSQTVIAGHMNAVKRVMHLAKQQGARLTKQLPISVPAHSELMRPAAQKFSIALDRITCQIPRIAVVNNVYSTTLFEPRAIKQSLVVQLYQPVRWVDNINYLLREGVSCFVECGPGQVLKSMIQRIASSKVKILSLSDYHSFQRALSSLK